MRVLRRENWLVALVNNEVLPLTHSLPLLGERPLLPQTLEWALYTTLVRSSLSLGRLRRLRGGRPAAAPELRPPLPPSLSRHFPFPPFSPFLPLS